MYISIVKQYFWLVTISLISIAGIEFIPTFGNCSYAQTYGIIGTGTVNNDTQVVGPTNNYYRRRVMHFVLTANELQAAGLECGATISEIGWYVTGLTDRQLPGYTVSMKHVAVANAAASLGTGGWTVVRTAFNYQAQSLTNNAWNQIAFTTNFVWNGTDNIGVQVCWSQTTGWDAYGQVRGTNIGNGIRHRQDDAAGSMCGQDPNATVGWRPNSRLRYENPIPTQVGSTAVANGTIPVAPTCTNWSNTWCAGSGTHSVLSLVSGVNYTVENTGAATCGTALPNAYIQAWGSGGVCSGFGPISTVGTNSVSFNANTTGNHRINVTSSNCNSNSCGGARGHDFTGRSAVLRYRQNTTVTNTTANSDLCGGSRPLTHTLAGAHNNPVPVWTIQSGGGTIVGTNYLPGAYLGSVTIRAQVGFCISDVTFTVASSSDAPTTITGPTSVCNPGSTSITASGGDTDPSDIEIWYDQPCNDAFTEPWNSQSYASGSTTLNSVDGILNVTSTTIDPMIMMYGIGSWDPNVYRYIQIRYRVTAGTAGNAEIFFTNGVSPVAIGGQMVSGPLVSDGNWNILNIDMSVHPSWTNSNITGWRYDWATASGVSMEIDFISLSANPIIGTGASINLSPSTTTTYYVARRGNCGTTGCLAQVITVESPSTAPTGVTGGGTYCVGNEVTLTQTGGALATGANYEWFTGSCGGTPAGTGPSINVNPNSTQTYFVRASGGICPATVCATTNVNLPTVSGNLSLDGESATCVVQENGWVHFYNSTSGRLLAAIDAKGQNLGNVTATSYVQVAPFEVDACADPQPQFNTAVLGRRWVITPQNQPTNPVDVRLYFHMNEYNALEPIANGNTNPNDNTVGYFDLLLSKYANTVTPGLVNSSAFDNCASGTTTIWNNFGSGTAVSVIMGFDPNGVYTQYTIDSFSEFWLHGSSSDSPLPVTLTSFNANCDENGVRVNWTTASELNSSHFVIERSRDGLVWEYVKEIEGAGNSNTVQSYEVLNLHLSSSLIYYRLHQFDLDGKEEIYGPISVNCENGLNSLSVYPNPATNAFTVLINADSKSDNASIELYDLSGKAIIHQTIKLEEGTNSINFNDAGLAKGSYLIRVQDVNNKFIPIKLIVN